MTTPTKEVERLVAVETKLDTVIDQLKDILTETRNMTTTYVPRTELLEWRRAADEEHRTIKADAAEYKKTINTALKTYKTTGISLFIIVAGILITAFFKLILKV